MFFFTKTELTQLPLQARFETSTLRRNGAAVKKVYVESPQLHTADNRKLNTPTNRYFIFGKKLFFIIP